MEEFLTNKDLLKIWKSYDAYYFVNKYGEARTHKEEFERIHELLKDDELSDKALRWIANRYDCYYKNEFEEKNDDNPFYYLQCRLNDLERDDSNETI